MQPKDPRRVNLAKPSDIKKLNEAYKEDSSAGEREKRLAFRRLVQSKEYTYLKNEAARIAKEHVTGAPKDGNSLIAFFSGSLIQTGFSLLFSRIETYAANVPEPVQQTTKRRSE